VHVCKQQLVQQQQVCAAMQLTLDQVNKKFEELEKKFTAIGLPSTMGAVSADDARSLQAVQGGAWGGMMPGMGGIMPGMEQSEELMQLMGVGRGRQIKEPKKKPGKPEKVPAPPGLAKKGMRADAPEFVPVGSTDHSPAPEDAPEPPAEDPSTPPVPLPLASDA
jgi:hypothetical protein